MPDRDFVTITLGGALQTGSPEYKTFRESLPYYLGDDYRIDIDGDTLIVHAVPAGSEDALTRAAQECFLAAQADHERATERVLQEFGGGRELREGIYEQLLAEGTLLPTGAGKVVYTGRMAELFLAVDGFVKGMCVEQGAREEFYPAVLEAESLKRAGYFETLAQHAYFVAPLKTRLDALAAARSGAVLSDDGASHLQSPEWVLSPTVCHHCFEARKDASIELPLKVTAINQCSRFEVFDTKELQRLRIYWMREFIQFDRDERQVLASLDALLARTTKALERWGVSYEVVTASDPFFSDSGTSKRAFQSTFALKRELRLPVPGKGLACASFNNHQHSLTNAFAVSPADRDSSDAVSSGCVGWGYDRLLFALFSQLGTDTDQWPQAMRDDLDL